MYFLHTAGKGVLQKVALSSSTFLGLVSLHRYSFIDPQTFSIKFKCGLYGGVNAFSSEVILCPPTHMFWIVILLKAMRAWEMFAEILNQSGIQDISIWCSIPGERVRTITSSSARLLHISTTEICYYFARISVLSPSQHFALLRTMHGLARLLRAIEPSATKL